MTDTPPCARDQQHPDQARVSRLRRAFFAFGVTFGAMGIISAIVGLKAPDNEVTTTGLHVLADIGCFIGLAYIGGSVVDYSGMFKSLGNRFGISIPVAQQGASS